mmetsp:Transcript_31416/g.48194  ORF Transcript_31416/g.48194 Transcript_31416/m.48194 type:complete len:330 (-) Transcript_31416:357-1346(-)|eukprot:CAMPEP_0195285830 /NCGR_PEP_ID=MMETSP0707-20130614/3522_1 /TAXON_ID=33640 /ORGANISM="Asterionellopsis glacialis, Strain CCMP134" /LENGTH=329 /DNA_ID=CAMNT_0040345383 /DNA_START=141 /DNA_END=1133 /DNA_ORIENTATION=-
MNENSEEQPIQFASEGFDLDALKDSSATGGETKNDDDAILEIGGGVTRMSVESPKSNSKTTNDTSSSVGQTKEEDPELLKCESLKLQGNQFFKARNWLDAYDSYTEAIDACPPQSLRGIDILKQKQEWENEQHLQALDDYRQGKHDTKRDASGEGEGVNNEQTSSSSSCKDDNKDDDSSKPTFQVPPHPHGAKYLSVYHCNRAACRLHLEQYKEAIDDCTIALLWKPDYVKAYMRRCHAHEHLEQFTEALEDVKMAQTLDPRNAQLRKDQQRLQRKNDEHLEKLKEQTMGQLKDLGNSILGNFGLSLDNFQAKQDPNTGSYSISFDQGK